ncbi:MAG: hypothetical protein ACPLYF_05505, partial [Fervidobacterium sp.]
MRQYFDLHVNFEWREYTREGYTKVFIPNMMGVNSSYNDDRINIAVYSKDSKLPKKYDLVFVQDYLPDIEMFAKMRGGAVELNLNYIKQAMMKGRMHRVRSFCSALLAYNVPYVFTSGAENIFEVKSPKEMAFAGELLGFTQRQVLHSMSTTAQSILREKKW